jgi:hypothetical protein
MRSTLLLPLPGSVTLALNCSNLLTVVTILVRKIDDHTH